MVLLSFLQENITIVTRNKTDKIILFADKNFMTILLGCVENINASLEQERAGKFNASVKKSILRPDEGNNWVYKKVFLRD